MTDFRLFQTERVCRRQFQIGYKWQKVHPNRQKTLWEKEKLLVTSNFSFSHSVFKRLILQTHKNQGLFGKGLTNLYRTPFENIVGKAENADKQHFLLFQQCLLPYERQKSSF